MTSDIAFPDSGLHLAALGALLDLGKVKPEELRVLLADIDPEDVERYRIQDAVSCLSSFSLRRSDVEFIKRLDFDGGNSIYMLIESSLEVDTGGEADYYELGSLEGIDQMSSLESLDLDGHGYRDADLDLSPLAGHPTLASLRLSGRCTNAGALERMPALKTLKLPYAKVDDDAVLDRLTARGVTVERKR